MNFQQTLEQDMLRSSVASALGKAAHADTRAILANLGIFGVLCTEENGGSGLGLVEAAIVLEEAGRAGAGASLAETLLVAGAVGRTRSEQADALLSGRLAVVSPVSGHLRQTEGRLHGTLTLSRPGPEDDIAVAIQGGSQLALLPASRFAQTKRAAIEAGSDACEITVDVEASASRLISIDNFVERLAVLRCAELLGIAEHCFALAVAYLNDRSQFGQPIGVNQALKHIAADTYLALENMRVAVEYAAAARDTADRACEDAALTNAADEAVQVMLAYVPHTAREIAEVAVQFHGGIGLTWDYALNACLRRIIRLGMGLGAVHAHRLALCTRVTTVANTREASASAKLRSEVHHAGIV